MIRIKVEAEVNGVLLQYERELSYAGSGSEALQIEKAESVLLEGYQKIKKGLESQK